MRQSLLNTFAELHLFDLHGGFRKGEVAPDGGPDKNVFDIQQGVAIALLSRHKQGETGVCHAEAWGTRESKQKLLSETATDSTPWSPITPQPPQYLFVPTDTALEEEYNKGWSVKEAFGLECLGIQTHRDSLAVGYTSSELLDKLDIFTDEKLNDAEAAAAVKVGDVAHWRVSEARSRLRGKGVEKTETARYAYRPFDYRALCYDGTIVDRLRPEVMPHLMKQNLALNTMRQTKRPDWRHAWVTNSATDAFVVEIKDGATTFPLYLYDLGSLTSQTPGGQTSRRANFVPEFISECGKSLGLRFTPDGRGDLRQHFGPEDILAYIYAVLWTPSYQSRYSTLLRRDFPRIPLTSDRDLFRALCGKGAELVSLHLMESPRLSNFITQFAVGGENTVEKVRFEEAHVGAGLAPARAASLSPRNREGSSPSPTSHAEPGGTRRPVGRVYINQTQYFDGVPKDVWEFHIGGYQVCEKWLKDRKGRQLSNDDINHYQKIVVALNETIRLMREIDEVIPGWPLP